MRFYFLLCLLLISSPLSASTSSELRYDIANMLNDSHRLKSAYLNYLSLIENEKLMRANGNPSLFINLSPYQYGWRRVSTDEGIGGSVIGDLAKASGVTNHLLNNLSNKLSALDGNDGVNANYDAVNKNQHTFSEYTLGLSHVLYDFGIKKANNHIATIEKQTSFDIYEEEKQNLILEGIESYNQIAIANDIILFIEQIKLDIKSDLSETTKDDDTDLKKVESTLKELDALILEQKNKLLEAKAHYKYIFNKEPNNTSSFEFIAIPEKEIAKDETDFLNQVKKNNLNIHTVRNDLLISKEGFNQVQAQQYPNISASVNTSLSYNAGGYDMKDENYSVALTANYSTNLFSGKYKLKKARLNIEKNQEHLRDVKSQVMKNARQQWASFTLARLELEKKIAALKDQQVFIANTREAYLDGKRSLLDLTKAQEDLVNSGITTLGTYENYVLQVYRMLALENNLHKNNIKTTNNSITLALKDVFKKD